MNGRELRNTTSPASICATDTLTTKWTSVLPNSANWVLTVGRLQPVQAKIVSQHTSSSNVKPYILHKTLAKAIKVGDYVRNTLSGKFGYVAGITADNRKPTVLTLKRTYASWSVKNVEPVKDATR